MAFKISRKSMVRGLPRRCGMATKGCDRIHSRSVKSGGQNLWTQVCDRLTSQFGNALGTLCGVQKRAGCGYNEPLAQTRGKPRNTFARYYKCPNFYRGNHVPGCPHQANVNKVDAELWRKVMLVLSDKSDFEDRVQTRVEELRHEEADAERSIERIKRELGLIAEERQWVITQARKKSFTEADMDKQLAGLDAQAQELRPELADKSLLIGDRAGRLTEFANQYRANMRTQVGMVERRTARRRGAGASIQSAA